MTSIVVDAQTGSQVMPWRLRVARAIVLGMAGALALPAVGTEAIKLVSTENAPFAYTSASTHQAIGLTTDIVATAAQRAAIPINVSLFPWARAYFLAQNNADTCVFPLARLPERERQFQWIGPLNKNRWVLFARSDFAAVIRSFDELRHYRIGGLIQDGPSVYLRARGVAVEQVSTNELNLNKLIAGRIDLWATGFHRGMLIASKANAGVLKQAFVIQEVDHYLACNLKLPAETVVALNLAAEAMWHDGTMKKINERYQDNPPD